MFMEERENKCYSTELVYADSTFNESGAREFVENVNLAQREIDYSIVSIMGPQSSGKSTLLNHLFGTNFSVMNAKEGRSQSTKGIWLAQSPTLGPRYLVIDIEGTDGQERGSDTTFENRSALFALAISDVVVLNMWCTGVGLVHATCQPLLRTVFQVMMQLFTRSKIKLVFVLRDKTETSLDKLKVLLEKNIQQIWEDTIKPQAQANIALDDRFNIEVVGLSNYRYAKEEFLKEVHDLRQLFQGFSTSGGTNIDWTPGSAFVDKAIKIWDQIMENKDLDLASIKEMVAIVRCDKIYSDKYHSFLENETWLQIKEDIKSSAVKGFGEKVDELIATYLSEYDEATLYYDEKVRNPKRYQLKETILQVLKPAYDSVLQHIRLAVVVNFRGAFENELKNSRAFSDVVRECIRNFHVALDNQLEDTFVQQSNWNDPTSVHEELIQEVNDYIAEVRDRNVSHLLEREKVLLVDELERPVNIHIKEANQITWVEIRRNLEDETHSAIVRLLDALSDFELDEGMSNDLEQQLANHGRNSLRDKARRIANPMFIMALMRERFQELFPFDSNSVPWEENEEIEAARQTAHSASVKILSVLAAIRFVDDNDAIEETLSAAFRIAHEAMSSLNSTNWGQIPQEDTLLDPFGCRVLWSDFLIQTTPIVNQAFEEVWQKKKQKYKKYALDVGVSVATRAVVAGVAGVAGAAVAAGGGAAAGGVANATRVAARAIGASADTVAVGDVAARAGVAGAAVAAAGGIAKATRVVARAAGAGTVAVGDVAARAVVAGVTGVAGAAVAAAGGVANATRVAARAIGAGAGTVAIGDVAVAVGDAAVAVAGGAANAARVATNAGRVVVSLIAPWLQKANRNA